MFYVFSLLLLLSTLYFTDNHSAKKARRAKSQANKGVLSFASRRDLGVCERTIMYVGIVQAKTPRSTGQNFRLTGGK